MQSSLYASTLWAIARTRALQRDGSRCTVARLLGGECTVTLHVHHLVRPEHGGSRYGLDNLVTVCSAHHPMVEALRRYMLDHAGRGEPQLRCPHHHPTREGREQCERRLARRRVAA